MRTPFLFAFCVLFYPAWAVATDYVVKPDGSGDYPTIQGAILAAEEGDTIWLADGTFMGEGNRNIDFLGKAITVRSQSGYPEDCIIDPEGTYGQPGLRAFDFQANEGPESIVRDITIMHGASDDC
jgi:hypothetical protein